MSKPIAASLSETIFKQKRPISFSGMNVNQVKSELAAQLNDNVTLLEKSGTSHISRNALIKQTDGIRKELMDLNQYEQEELPEEIRLRLEGLANEVQSLKSSKSNGLHDKNINSSPLSLPPAPTNSSPSKQRTKVANGNRRNPDIEFATEIGQGLLVEVRKLQANIQEKDERIKYLELAFADKERNQETSQRHLKQREEVEDRLKEENWNLEVANQELRAHLSESNQAVTKHNSEFSRVTKQLKSQSEQIDIMKLQEEKNASVVEAMKARHEQETVLSRRHVASAQRDNAQLQKQIETLNTELKICNAKLSIKLATTSRTADELNTIEPNAEPLQTQHSESDQINNATTVTVSPQSRNQAMEAETLKQSLAHAHRIISNLRSSCHKEKLEKFEIKKMLSDSQETIEQMSKEMTSWNANSITSLENGGHGRTKANGKKKPLTKKRRGGVARQPRGLCPNESDTDQQLELNEEEEEQEEEEEEKVPAAESEEENDSESAEEDPMRYFGNAAGNTLDSIFANSTPFVSTSMKPLFSELEAKVQVIDAGTNTDPMEFGACAHKHRSSDSLSSPSTLMVSSSILPVNEHDKGLSDTRSDSPVVVVVVQDRNSPHSDHQEVSCTHDAVNDTTESQMIPKADVDKMIESAILEKTVDMVHKSEMQELIANSVQEEKSKLEEQIAANMIPKTEADALVHAATEKANAEAVEIQKNMVTKAEMDNLIQEARNESIIEAQKGMLTETEANTMALTAVTLATEKLIQKAELDKLVLELEGQKDAELKGQKQEIESTNAVKLEKQRSDIQALMQAKLNEQKEEIESRIADIEKENKEANAVKQAEIEDLSKNIEAYKKESEETAQKIKMMLTQDSANVLLQRALEAEIEKKQEANTVKQAEIDALSKNIEAYKKESEETAQRMKTMLTEDSANILVQRAVEAEIEKKKEEINTMKQAELDAQSKHIEAYKKESEETVQRMKTMFTKDSANVLVQRAVAGALEAADKKHSEALVGMISREYALRMMQDEVIKALEVERKKSIEREEAVTMQMISKAEAEALSRVAVADAIVSERQTMAAREKELISKEEAEALAESAARKAADKERTEHALVLAKERKTIREKEGRMIYKEEAEQNTKEAVRIAVLEYAKANPREISSTMNNVRPVSTRFGSQAPLEAPKSIERSVSTSRLTLSSANVSPAPSVSTPASTGRKLKLSNSVSSFRLGSGRKENNIQKSQRSSTESTGNSFGSFRILESSKYTPRRLQSKSSISLRELSHKQSSSTSISTMSSNDDAGRMHMPMRSDESFTGFPSNGGTDVQVISAITQTMIGEWMSKHTRRYVGGGISENKHQRFFWVHPYTGTLYWSSVEPGYEGNGAKAKSAFIGSVSAIPSHDNTGASPLSLLIHTPKRDLKITAPSLERHELWLKSLTFLLQRPYDTNNSSLEEPRLTSDSSVVNAGHQQSTNSGTINTNASDRSIPQMMDLTQYDSDDSDDMVNIRQCCDGKHDVSTLSRGQHHH